MYKHLFGPVPSRRLGASLGVDLVTPKSCNLNCIFCECGKTEKLSKERKIFKDINEIKIELTHALAEMSPDYVTFSGAGEPTLSLDLGNIIDFIKDNFKVKVAVITNGLLFNDENVRQELSRADLIATKINSTRKNIFDQICRAEDVEISDCMHGLKIFSEYYKGNVYLETFIIENINDEKEQIIELTDFVKTIKITKWQLNTLARKGAENWVMPANGETLQRIRTEIINCGYPPEKIEIIGEFSEKINKFEKNKDLVKNMLEKREYKKEDIKKIFKA
ncbi:MAG: radical SAM protein [Fusobacteriaceae bacterium]|jgi:wyosine [tRNA(Phe)-imidazoG37] synthetase (radical SAM superfamily)|nr:radical SAM protein [Fusobacteriaceae bacterium]